MGYGKTWAVELSLIVAAVLTVSLYITGVFSGHPGLLFIIFVGTFVTFPGIFRFLVCRDWEHTKANVISQSDILRPFFGWRGNVSITSNHEAEICYEISGKNYKNKLHSARPFGSEIAIFYDPKRPDRISKTKGLGLQGYGFICLILALTLYALIK